MYEVMTLWSYYLEGKPNDSELCSILNKLILSWESEVVEFKEAGKDYDKNKIVQYFSAISNEANLKGLQHGWLVFGVRNKDRMIVGSDYRNSKGLDVLKQEFSVGTTGGISFIEIYEVYPLIDGEKKRVILFQIPAATTETKQYDMWLLRELLNNCIAHSEYTYGGRIYLNEFEDRIILTNPGSFLPGRIEPILNPGYNPPFYRNQLLAETMVKLNMIDSQSTGIRRVFRIQKERYFPLPDYDFSNRQQVKVCIYGRILDENYSQILFKNPDFDLETVFLIDCVQKGIKIDKDAVKYLRKLKIIEGKIPNLFLSATISETIGEKDRYVKNKAFDDQYYKDLIVKYLAQYGSARRKDIQALLWDKLPSIMADKQKEDKIRNLLTSLRKQGIIRTDSGNQQKSSWILTDKIKQGK